MRILTGPRAEAAARLAGKGRTTNTVGTNDSSAAAALRLPSTMQ